MFLPNSIAFLTSVDEITLFVVLVICSNKLVTKGLTFEVIVSKLDSGLVFPSLAGGVADEVTDRFAFSINKLNRGLIGNNNVSNFIGESFILSLEVFPNFLRDSKAESNAETTDL